MSVIRYVAKKPVFHAQLSRQYFHWVHLQFNVVNEERLKKFGPDRTCAEWILRNGGSVKWAQSSKVLSNYNELPSEGTKLILEEVDASKTSIMQNGFVHFKGCKQLKKLILHRCGYVNDQALTDLEYLKGSLLYLQISSCPTITDKGLLTLKQLTKLEELLLFDLPVAKDLQNTIQALKSSLSSCKVQTK